MDITELLKKAADMGASDIHITVGVPFIFRINGKLLPIGDRILRPEDTRDIVKELTTDKQFNSLNRKGEIDFSYSVPGLQRFRVNAYRQRSSYSVALRLIPFSIPSLEDLGLPPIIKDLTQKSRGLILVTGPTGSGKSTTLASMIDLINSTRDRHIITIEDPIEYLFQHKKSIVNQREIGSDTLSFANALRASLRQDPDVILIGEMRDQETIATALTAAETGHLVLSTLHTIGAAKTVDRVIDVFPPHQQQQVRVQMSMALQGVVSQQLLIKSGGDGRIVAVETMIMNVAVANIIREGKLHQLNNVIQTNASRGMKLMDDALADLYRQSLISRETALMYCIDQEYLKKNLNRS
ncbi:MAG: type IV pilus twitching motility protein PilT [Clostridiales bacterium]|nr:type IV pilus twitching motility protein PilT [Clostridiales bacterium]